MDWRKFFVEETAAALESFKSSLKEKDEKIFKLKEIVKDLHAKVEKLEKIEKLENKQGMKKSYADIAKANTDNKAKVIKIVEEKLQRDCNLIFHGIEEKEDEDISKIMSPILDHMEISEYMGKEDPDCRRVGRNKKEKKSVQDKSRLVMDYTKNQDGNQKVQSPRPIRVKCENREFRDFFLTKGKLLQSFNGGKIFVTTDKSVEERIQLKTLLEEAKKRNENQRDKLKEKSEKWRVVGKIHPRLRKVKIPEDSDKDKEEDEEEEEEDVGIKASKLFRKCTRRN